MWERLQNQVSLVQLNPLAVVHARAGAFYFACVVILTIFATGLFDPRLMWVNEESEPAE